LSDTRIFRRHFTVLAPIIALLTVSGCSTTTTSSTSAQHGVTTTSGRIAVEPPPPNASTVTAYLNSTGSPFLSFERASMELGKGMIPSKPTCARLAKVILQGTTSNPNMVLAAIKGIPDAAISFAANQDFQTKSALLGECLQGNASDQVANRAMAASELITGELNQLGIKL
jgi:hypothetical protein